MPAQKENFGVLKVPLKVLLKHTENNVNAFVLMRS